MKKAFLILLFGMTSNSLEALNNFTGINMSLATPSTSTEKYANYKLPKFGVMTKLHEANFEVFPKEIQPELYFATSSPASTTLLAISRKWQTACLYNASGTITSAFGHKMCFQVGTGQKKQRKIRGHLTDLQTPLGLYVIQTKKGANYFSRLFSVDGKEIPPEELIGKTDEEQKKLFNLAPMPYAMHIGKVVWLEGQRPVDFLPSYGIAIHERETTSKFGSYPFVSHGCVAIPKNYGRYLQTIMKIGDMVMIFEEDIPRNLQEAMLLGIMSFK